MDKNQNGGYMIIDFHTHIFQPDVCSNRQNYFDAEPEFKLLYEPENSKTGGG